MGWPGSLRDLALGAGVATSALAAAAWSCESASPDTRAVASQGHGVAETAPRLPALAQVVFTGDDQGEIEPCGCSAAMLGGLTRRVARLRALREESPDALFVVGGGLVAGSTAYDRLGLDVTLEMLRHAEPDLYVASARDLACAAPGTLRSESLAGTRVIEAPWNGAAPPSRSSPGTLRVTQGATEMVVISVWGGCDGRAAAAVAAMRRDLARDAVLVVVSDAPRDRLEALRAAEAGAVLVLCADGVTDPADTTLDADAPAFVSLPSGGKYVGVATLVGARDAVRWDIQYRAVLPDLPEEPAVTQAADARRLALHATHAAESSSADTRFAVGAMDVPGARYAGSDACKTCHSSAWSTWVQSEHARALDTLEEIGQDADPACVRCHVVAYGTGRGFTSDRSRGELAAVGCEACHGPRADHIDAVRRGDSSGAPRQRTSATDACFACHDAKHSPQFEFDAYWRKIHHE